MVKRGHGGFTSVVSSISTLHGGRFQTHYTPTKTGILSLMQSMSIALGEHRIRCNALMPETVRSQLSVEEIGQQESRERLIANFFFGGTLEFCICHFYHLLDLSPVD